MSAYVIVEFTVKDPDAYCKACHPGAIQPKWTQERVLAAMREWVERYGRLPSSYDWSRTHDRRRGGEAQERLEKGEWPSASVVTDVREACASLGCSEEFFVEHLRPHLRVVRRGRKRLFPVAELRRAVDEMAEYVI